MNESKERPSNEMDNSDADRMSAASDPFDPNRLRLSQDFASSLGVKKALTTIPVRKPAKEWWVRRHPDPDFGFATGVIELKEEQEIYLVDPSLWEDLASESTFGPRALFTTISRQGVLFLWPVRLPGPDGKQDPWNRSALEAAEIAKNGWIRIAANMHLGAYEVSTTTATWSEPAWPSESFQELLTVAFKDRFIDSKDHPVLKRLRGEE